MLISKIKVQTLSSTVVEELEKANANSVLTALCSN